MDKNVKYFACPSCGYKEFRSQNAVKLREALREAKRKKPKFYSSAETLIADSLR